MRFFLFVFVLLLLCCLAGAPVSAAIEPVGKLVYAQGRVELRPAGQDGWRQVTAGEILHAGDALATAAAAKAAVLCLDESQIKLNENTTMVFKAAARSARLPGIAPVSTQSGGKSLYEVPRGEAWVKNEAERFPFELITPAVTASIRGTEFVVTVAADGASTVALLGGALVLFNAQGELGLAPGEIGAARPGMAPTKQVLVNPDDTVQWTLYYPAVADPSELLSGEPIGPGTTVARNALARAQNGDLAGARAEMERLARQQVPSAGFEVVAAYLALMEGEPAAAKISLAKALAIEPANVPAQCFTAQLALYENHKEKAATLARAAVDAAPDSALAQVTAGLADMATFDLADASARFQQALVLSPRFVAAAVYLARIQLGSDDLEGAKRTINAALAQAPNEALVQSTAGFVRLGFNEFKAAERHFVKASSLDPGLGEANLGLGYVAYSRGHAAEGLEQMLTATLLCPRVALLQATLGKALYQNRQFAKALATYDYAARLDPRDPTPHLYKGIALMDLNRPGEAIMEINDSIAKNDNQAIFRTRLTLDRDLSVRNVNLSRAYNSLGMSSWAYSKALTAEKKDPFNPSAHLFLGTAILDSNATIGAAGSEVLIYYILSRANNATFNVALDKSDDYSPMFSTPYTRATIESSAGIIDNKDRLWNTKGTVKAAMPGLAAVASAGPSGDSMANDLNTYSNEFSTNLTGKWDMTVWDSLLAKFAAKDRASRTADSRNSVSHTIEYFNYDQEELGYVHRFGPNANFIAYVSGANWRNVTRERSYDNYYENSSPALYYSKLGNEVMARKYVNIQSQQQLVIENHSLMIGGDYYNGEEDYLHKRLFKFFADGSYLPDRFYRDHNNAPSISLNLYALDYWKISPSLIVELGLGYNWVQAARTTWSSNISIQEPSAKAGLNWQVNADQTLRLAFQRYVNKHFFQFTIVPSEVAGFADHINADDGSIVTELGAAWESQWNKRTFSVAKLNFLRLEMPEHDTLSTYDRIIFMNMERCSVSADINYILTPYLGFTLGGAVKNIRADDIAVRRGLFHNYFELEGRPGLYFLHESGLGASVNCDFIHQYYLDDKYADFLGESKKNSTFGILNASISYELPYKRGRLTLEGSNLANTRSPYQAEIPADEVQFPSRTILFKLKLNY